MSTPEPFVGMGPDELRYHQALRYMAQLAWEAGDADEVIRAVRHIVLDRQGRERIANEPTQLLPTLEPPSLVRPYIHH